MEAGAPLSHPTSSKPTRLWIVCGRLVWPQSRCLGWPALAFGAGLPALACQFSLCKWTDFLLFNSTGHAQASSCFP